MKDQKIIQYLSGFVSEAEENRIHNWIMASRENAAKFNQLKAAYIASTFGDTAKEVDLDEKFSEFLEVKDHTSNTRPSTFPVFLKYAATVGIIFGIGYGYFTGFFNSKSEKLVIPEETILLTLDDGHIQAIEVDSKQQVVSSKGRVLGTQSGNSLNYHQNINQNQPEPVAYHTLTVPYGKRFEVVLSDGTQVHLNAGTSLKYPVKFINGNDRKVFLQGEAFFNVAKDAAHAFIVNTNELNVTVLGTRFNVSSYPEDAFIRTVLVEGAINLSADSQKAEAVTLSPDHQAIWNKEDKGISVEEVDPTPYTSWVNGKIVFRHMPFKNITKKLERHYNVSIICNNEVLNNEAYTASFDTESIEEVLEAFNRNYSIRHTIKNNEIIIN